MKSATTLFFILFTLTLSAQYEKGNWYLDGTSNTGYQRSVGKNTPDNAYFSISAFRAGYFFTERLLLGSRISFYSIANSGFLQGQTNLQLRPFARYYFPGGTERKVSYFGDIGFGNFNLFGRGDAFETDFHFGGGAEVRLQPGILGTANLRYDANASGLNFTNLTFGLNVLMGQLENAGSAVSLTAGTFMTHARLGGLRYGRMSANGNVDQSTSFNLTPWAGYFITNRLMLEGSLSVYYSKNSNEIGDTNIAIVSSYVGVGADLNVRYYLKQDGKLLPYLMAGGGFSINTLKFSNNFGESSNTSKNVPLRAGAGSTYFLSPNLALDAAIIYDQWTQLDQFQIADFATRKNIGFDVGFRFFLPKG